MNESRSAADAPVSALDAALSRVGDRWSLLIVDSLLDGPRRFNELAAGLPGIAPNILTDRLRRLERHAVVISRRYSERPARVAYGLSQEGIELAGVLRLLAAWGQTTSDEDRGVIDGEGLRHRACGSLLEAAWYCPTCAQPVADEAASELRYA